jgi:hypothetical protein
VEELSVAFTNKKRILTSTDSSSFKMQYFFFVGYNIGRSLRETELLDVIDRLMALISGII